jgi:hypothetical protein
MGILLGGILLDGYEAPAGLAFGGAQSLAVHKLPGGIRIVDAMGPDDADISWHGYLSGNDAMYRARQLDMMRSAGQSLILSWSSVVYSVVISSLNLTYASPWWIPYSIRCTVLTLPVGGVVSLPSSATLIADDLTAASAWIQVAALSTALAQPGALTLGTQSNAAASNLVSGTMVAVNTGVSNAEVGLSAGDVPSMVVAAGTLAGLLAAKAYLGRAAVNLTNAGA